MCASLRVNCHTWKLVGNTVGPFVAVLFVDVDTVHGCCKTTGLALLRTKQVCCRRTVLREVESEARGRESVPNRNQTKSKFYSLYFNLSSSILLCF